MMSIPEIAVTPPTQDSDESEDRDRLSSDYGDGMRGLHVIHSRFIQDPKTLANQLRSMFGSGKFEVTVS